MSPVNFFLMMFVYATIETNYFSLNMCQLRSWEALKHTRLETIRNGHKLDLIQELLGDFLTVQWLRPMLPLQGSRGWVHSPGWGTKRSYMP